MTEQGDLHNERSLRAPTRIMVTTAVAFEAALIVAALVLGWLLDEPPVSDFGFTLGGLAWGVAAVVPMLGLLWFSRQISWRPFRRLRIVLDRRLMPMFRGWSPWDLASLSLVAGVSEEMLFRGVVQDAATSRYGLPMGLMIGSLVFGMLHAVTRTYAVLVTLIGVYLGAIYVACGNLLVPIIAHGLYDFLALLYLARLDARRQARTQSAPQ